ncbi:hypothetical protein G6R40_00120 [Chryseobacterium sp. POL2]|uniref:hypothetical protein n=1 Tax=Chryseobacterium sp. POL2 TaxID=2713414 RepID=UPI0013E1A62E|nr:hypothetical protein [Chryseobacterium sp. POL2]QIG88160.1 hypothetical protein G6R40_00120 [Chryseobacterium sp. POL2]
MKHQILFLIIFTFSLNIFAQKTEKIKLENPEDYYLKIIPKGKPNAILFLFHGGGETPEDILKQIELPKLASKNNFLVILPHFSNDSTKMFEEINSTNIIANQLMKEYNISNNRIVLGGFSGGGMLSITFAERAVRDKNTSFIPKAIFAIDVPLDYEQMYERAQREIKRNFSEIGVSEANWVINDFNTTFGGSPTDFPNEYEKYSMFTYRKEDGGNAKYLIDIPIRIYTEPGIEWQLENRHRDLYDLNCTNISAMINLLQLNGNKNAEIISTFNKGKRLNGTKHPHSWSIMDSNDTMNWIIKQIK